MCWCRKMDQGCGSGEGVGGSVGGGLEGGACVEGDGELCLGGVFEHQVSRRLGSGRWGEGCVGLRL